MELMHTMGALSGLVCLMMALYSAKRLLRTSLWGCKNQCSTR